ncbi:MAG: hypothetical protein WC314_07430 [Vulcanimicrobiota bacterium]
MAVSTRRGFTLIEIIIYFALSVAALAILYSLFTVLRRTGEHTYAQYLVSGDLSTTMRMVRKDLQSTALASITSQGAEAGEEPGVSCVSGYNQDGELQLGAYGVPHWQKHVYYTLDTEGAITRWSKDIADKNYLPSLAPPLVKDQSGRVLMSDALPPNTSVGQWHTGSSYGGLEVGFVRRDGAAESVVPQNPRESTDPEQNTRLVQVILRLLEEEGPNFLEIKFRVFPKY